MREKVGKSRNTVFFQWFGAPEGRKVGSLKRRMRSQLARWEMKKCTPLWREAHFQVKMYKTPGARSTFGSWDVEKVHAVVARSTFRSQNVCKLCVSCVWVSCVYVTVVCVRRREARGRNGRRRPGYRIKSKNPTQRCEETKHELQTKALSEKFFVFAFSVFPGVLLQCIFTSFKSSSSRFSEILHTFKFGWAPSRCPFFADVLIVWAPSQKVTQNHGKKYKAAKTRTYNK